VGFIFCVGPIHDDGFSHAWLVFSFIFPPGAPTKRKRRKQKFAVILKLCISLSGLKEAQQLKLHLASIGT
jgi:hypothetical protein